MINKIIGINDFFKIRDNLKRDGKKVVFTNGCFDIIHRGHIEYLSKSKELGDILVIGLNTDKSVKKIKGENRPIVGEIDRAIVLSSLYFVDYIIFFDDDTPENLIKQVKPDILVKGADWSIDKIVGGDFVISNGGEVKTIELTEGKSTTDIIERIIKIYGKKIISDK